jgi:replicative DNA helicase Mcm
MARAENTELVEDFETFLRRYYSDEVATLASKYPTEDRSLEIDWMDLYRYDDDLADDYLTNPEQLREYAEEALRLYDLPVDVSLSQAHVRVTNLPGPSVRNVGQYLEQDVGSLLSVRGQVQKRTPKRPVLTESAFECQRCGTLTYSPQNDIGDFQEPYECQGCERDGPFKVNFEQSERDDYQKIRLQVPPGLVEEQSNENLDVQLRDDMVDAVSPGDRVKANIELNARMVDTDSAGMEYYARAHSVEVQETDWEDVEIEAYKDEFMEIAHSGNPYQQIVKSINPTHHGDEDIKLAIGLQLFSGVKKQHGDSSTTRGNFHIFLVGDPGTGKSTHLQDAAHLAPRSVYTSGKGNSAAGLTASAVRDDFGEQEWNLEGGTMVKANNGLAAIDELDKMDEKDRAGMFEALSEQQVSVSKAGIVATLPAETSLLAGANPKYGRFDQYEPIGEQIDLDPALISRFDLIFTVTDQPDEDEDKEVVRSKNQSWRNGLKRASDDVPTSEVDDTDTRAIPEDVMRAYIAYARQNVVPKPTREAEKRLEEEFMRLRLANAGSDEDSPVPVTYRQQEAMQRLAEASARIRLSDTLTVEDVERAVELVKNCLRDVGVDPETGQFDADAVETGSTKSQTDRVKWTKKQVAAFEDETNYGAPRDLVLEEAEERGFQRSKIEYVLDEKLPSKGEIYEPKDDHYRAT